MELQEGAFLVTIKRRHSLFKFGTEEIANSIELLEFNEIGNTVIAGKDQFKAGEIVIFIEPDWHLPDTELFKEYHRPSGDPKKVN